MPALTKREIVQVIGIGLIILAVSSIPYVLGYCSAAPGMQFGGFLVDLDDSYSYLSTMQQGVGDGWRYRILFTPEEHPGAYLNTFYLSLGKLSSWLGLSLMQTYHLARVACGLSLLAMAYVFLSLFLEERAIRLVAYLLISFSSGLGWLILLGGSTTLGGIVPMDFWAANAYTFLTIFTFPHTSAAVCLLLLFFTLALRYFETFQLRALLLASLISLGLCIIHPFTALLTDGVLATYWALVWLKRKRLPGREMLAMAIWALTPLPLITYYYQVFASDPVFRGWAAQTVLSSVPAPNFLLGYGIVLLLALAGFAHTLRQRNERNQLLVAWVISAVVLFYLPFTLQRRMIEGLHVPLCILATFGLCKYVLPAALNASWLNKLARRRGYGKHGLRRLLVYSVIIATFPSNVIVVAGSSVSVLNNHPPLYYREEEFEAVDWLKNNTKPTETVLASYEIGRLIAARAGNRVFMGHSHQTLEIRQKEQLAVTFFRETTGDEYRRTLLSDYGIRYVYHGPAERQVGDFGPSRAAYLMPIHSNSYVTIYQANP